MPKLEHWIIAAKKVEVLNTETAAAVAALGGVPEDGWYDTHQHLCVNPYNKEHIEEILRAAGYVVSGVSEGRVLHPELHPEYVYDARHDASAPESAGWLIASRMLPVLDRDTLKAVFDAGGEVAGGWCEVHQHIRVDEGNREQIREVLRAANLTVTAPAQ